MALQYCTALVSLKMETPGPFMGTREDVLETYEVMKKNQYGQYLKDVLDGKYVDAKKG